MKKKDIGLCGTSCGRYRSSHPEPDQHSHQGDIPLFVIGRFERNFKKVRLGPKTWRNGDFPEIASGR
jgi:hypothetical protein